MPKEINVFVAHPGGGIARPCTAYRAPGGCFWVCVFCDEPVMAANFGVLSGFWRCPCGAEVTLMVDGEPVDIQRLNSLPHEDGGDAANVAAVPEPPREFSDENFLRECGIADDPRAFDTKE